MTGLNGYLQKLGYLPVKMVNLHQFPSGSCRYSPMLRESPNPDPTPGAAVSCLGSWLTASHWLASRMLGERSMRRLVVPSRSLRNAICRGRLVDPERCPDWNDEGDIRLGYFGALVERHVHDVRLLYEDLAGAEA
jgi:hypothetical protein